MHEDYVHAAPLSNYIKTFAALMVLLVVTVAVARVDLGWFNMPVAMGIASIKMVLVVLYFMHLKGSDKLSKIWAFTGVFFFIIMIGLSLSDYDTRYMDKTRSPVAPAGHPQDK